MGVTSEITRIRSAKESILSALDEKGVSLTGTEKIDDIPPLIADIKSRYAGLVFFAVSDAGRLIMSCTNEDESGMFRINSDGRLVYLSDTEGTLFSYSINDAGSLILEVNENGG